MDPTKPILGTLLPTKIYTRIPTTNPPTEAINLEFNHLTPNTTALHLKNKSHTQN